MFGRILIVSVLSVLMVACKNARVEDPAEGSVIYLASPGPEALKKIHQNLQQAVKSGDTASAGEIVKALLPDRASLKRAMSEKIDREIFESIVAWHAKQASDDEVALAEMITMVPEQSEVQVHATTVEELAIYEKGSVAYEEFPGGAQRFAKNGWLRKGATFYEVEFVKPGETNGMRYHLFFWDGAAWKMLGPVWRALQSQG